MSQNNSSELCRMPLDHVCWSRCDPAMDEHYHPDSERVSVPVVETEPCDGCGAFPPYHTRRDCPLGPTPTVETGRVEQDVCPHGYLRCHCDECSRRDAHRYEMKEAFEGGLISQREYEGQMDLMDEAETKNQRVCLNHCEHHSA